VAGNSEPVYLPSFGTNPAEIRFTQNYIRSALHELAHWCIAGEDRRKLVDYGYWYRPDGRNPEEQNEFFQKEVKPQALELAFSKRCSVPFEVSCDNLAGAEIHKGDFEAKVHEQLRWYEANGFPARAVAAIQALNLPDDSRRMGQ